MALIEGPPAVDGLLPHEEPARLLRVIVEASAERLLGVAVVPAASPFAVQTAGGELRAPAFLGLEAGAQAAAALEALARLAREASPAAGPQVGYLVGVKEAVFHRPDLPVLAPLAVEVRAVGSAPPLAVYEVWVRAEEALVVHATLSTYRSA